MTRELELYVRFNLRPIYWLREGTDPKDWKGPNKKGWNDPTRIYDLSRFDPAIHNIGTFTGREIAPGKFLVDVDVDKLNQFFVRRFLPDTGFALDRPGKSPSHLLYTTEVQLQGRRQYKAIVDGKPYIELRGLASNLQTMLAPSLHTPPDLRVALLRSTEITHVDLSRLESASLDYSIASLVVDCFSGGFHHDERLALAGYLRKRQFDSDRVKTLLQTICAYQVECRISDMSDYDVEDAVDVVRSTDKRLKHNEIVNGATALREINADFIKRLQTWLPRIEGAVSVDDFYAYMPTHSYLFVPSREFWPASSVNAQIFPIAVGTNEKGAEETIAANVWLDQHRHVEQMTWAPGHPLIIPDRLVAEGGWIERTGCSCINLYRPPAITPGDPTLAEPWLELVRGVYPQDVDHLVAWFAHRVQRPHEKINHAIVLGGVPGIGKDTLLEPVKHAIGPWNFADISPSHLLGRFNGFVKSVILRISEARDLGELNRFDFYEHMKVYAAAPPDVLRVDEKNIREHAVFNVCGVVITTNHETDGIYLPPDDRRHYVAWSPMTPADFPDGYWKQIYDWYASGGDRHVAAYLATLDISTFNPKAPPPKTEAFWAIVDANRPSENAELADLIEQANNPKAVTIDLLINACSPAMTDLRQWLEDRKNRRLVPHRMKAIDYVPFRNEGAKDGLWKIDDRRQAVYVREELSVRERQAAVEGLARTGPDSLVSEVSDLQTSLAKAKGGVGREEF